MTSFKRVALFCAVACLSMFGQTKINPASQVNWSAPGWSPSQAGALPAAGGSVTGVVTIGTTALIDSSFYSTFAQACSAAQAAGMTLYLTKAWTSVPTQTANCNITVPTGVRGIGALIQMATNATLTFTGQYSGPLAQWIDVTTNSGAALVWHSSSNLYPDYLGATGSGSGHDDAPYLNAALATVTSDTSQPTLHLAANEDYYTTQLLNGTCLSGSTTLKIVGDQPGATLTSAVTTGSQGSMLDAGGCNGVRMSYVAIQPPSGNPANSPMTTSALLISNGHWTSGYNAQAGNQAFLDHVSFCGGYNEATSSGANTASLVLLSGDLPTVQNSVLGCNGGVGYGGGHGSGIVAGISLGHATAVTSAFYTFNPTPGFPTRLTFLNNAIYGDYAAPFQISGGGLYIIDGGYLVNVDGGTGGSQIDWSGTTVNSVNYSGYGGLKCSGLNTENQSSNSSVNFFEIEASLQAGQGVDCEGRFDAPGSLIAAPTAFGAISKVTIKNDDGSAGSIFNLAASYQVRTTKIQEGYQDTSFGTIGSGVVFAGDTITAHFACSTLISDLSVNGSLGNEAFGINGCHQYTDVGFSSGLLLNGSGLSNGVGLLGISPGLMTWNQPFNLNGIVSGSLSNLGTWTNNFTAGTWTNSGFTITSGQPDPWGGNTATILSCSSNCTLTDTYSATPLTASTNYQACVYGSLTSGTNSFYMLVGGASFVGGGILASSGWGPACLTINSGSSNLTRTLEIQAPNGPTTITLYGVSVAVASTPTAGYQYTGPTPQPTPTLGLSPNFAINGQPATFSNLTLGGGHSFTRHATLSASLTPSAVAASTCAVQTLSVTGALAGDFVTAVIPPSSLSHVSIGTGMVTGSGTIAINFCGDSTGGTPPSGTWNFDVEQ